MSTFQLPVDYQAEQDALARKRKIAEMLAQQSQTPQQGQMVGGRYIAPSPLSGLLQLGQTFLADRMQKDLDTKQAGLASRYRGDVQSGLDKFFKTYNGGEGVMNEGQVADLMLNDQAPQLQATPGNPHQAVIEAMASGLPALQQIGAAELPALLKQGKSTGANIKEAGGRFYDLSSGKPVDIGGAEFTATETIGGDLYQRGPGGKLYKLDNAPKVTATATNVNAADKGMAKYLEQQGSALAPGGKSHEGASAATEALQMSAEAVQATRDGAKQGIAQPALQIMRKIGAELGMPDAATAPTDALTAALKASVFKDLGGLGAQVSDADRKFVTEFSGDLATDPQALKRMLAIRIAAQMKRVNTHNKQAEAFGRSVNDQNFAESAGVPLNITIPDDEVAAMVDNVMLGRPTTYGKSVGKPAGGKPSGPIVKNW